MSGSHGHTHKAADSSFDLQRRRTPGTSLRAGQTDSGQTLTFTSGRPSPQHRNPPNTPLSRHAEVAHPLHHRPPQACKSGRPRSRAATVQDGAVRPGPALHSTAQPRTAPQNPPAAPTPACPGPGAHQSRPSREGTGHGRGDAHGQHPRSLSERSSAAAASGRLAQNGRARGKVKAASPPDPEVPPLAFTSGRKSFFFFNCSFFFFF